MRYPVTIMLFSFKSRLLDRKLEDISSVIATTASEALAALPELEDLEDSTLLRTVAWVSAGMGALALGLFVGRELRQRYTFNRRTPYDFYAHSGDERQGIEFGVGV